MRPRKNLLRQFLDSSGSLSRREMIQLGLLAGGSAILPNLNSARTMPTPENFDFIAVNDLHYHNAECDAWFYTVFEAMRKSAPQAEFVLLGGDLADEGKPEQLQQFHALLPKLDLPYYAVPGNHDYTSATDRSTYDKLFAGHSNSSFTHRGWQFIGLDSTEGNLWHDTNIAQVTLDYLGEALAKIKKQTPLVVFTHFPMGENIILPPQKPGAEPFNFRPVNTAALLSQLEGYNLQAIFSGHFHGYTERFMGQTSLTTNKCCSRVQNNHDGTIEKGWFVCEAREGKISRRFVEIPESLRS